MHADGVTVRPLRQMSGGASFNEVFFDGLRIPDSLRMDAEGAGWRVAMTTLGFERSAGSGETGGLVPGKVTRLLQLARHLERVEEPVVRQELVGLWSHYRVQALTLQRARARLRAGQTPGPEGSIGKLSNDLGNVRMTRVASLLLGARLTADTRRVGHLGLVGARDRHPRWPVGRRDRRDPAQHHRRAGPRPPRRAPHRPRRPLEPDPPQLTARASRTTE